MPWICWPLTSRHVRRRAVVPRSGCGVTKSKLMTWLPRQGRRYERCALAPKSAVVTVRRVCVPEVSVSATGKNTLHVCIGRKQTFRLRYLLSATVQIIPANSTGHLQPGPHQGAAG